MAQNRRECAFGIVARKGERVGVANTGGFDFYQNLAGGRARKVALLPRRCAITEIASGRLVAVLVAGVSRKRQVMLVCRKAHRSHAADAFLAVAQDKSHVQAESKPDQHKGHQGGHNAKSGNP